MMFRPLSLALVMTVGAIGLAACRAPSESTEQATHSNVAEAFSSDHMTVETTGAGPDVILVPGLASNAAIWDETATALSDRYTVHVVQVSGFGGPPARGNAGNTEILPTLSAEIVRYGQSLETPAALIGHSLGGLVTLMAGLEDQSAFDRLMTIDVLPFFSVLTNPAATSDAVAPFAEIARTTLIGQSADEFAARQDAALAGLVKAEDDRALALSWSVASDRDVMAQAMSEVLVTDLRADMANLDLPLTVLYARDPAIPNMDYIETRYREDYAPAPQVTLVPVDGALHFIMMDQPDAFLTAIETFLAEPPA